MPSDRTSRSRRDRRSHRREDLDARGSGYSHRDSRNLQHEDHSRSSTNPGDYYAGSGPYCPGSGDQDDYDRDASRDGDDELSESDTTRRPSEWGMIPYQDPTISTTPSVASDSTLVLEAPAFDARPPPSRRRRYRSRSRDRYHANYDSAGGVFDSSRPFPAERSYSLSPDPYAHGTSSRRQSSQGHSYAGSTRNRQREEDRSYPADQYPADHYEREDCSQVSYRTIHFMDGDDYSHYSDQEYSQRYRYPSGTTQTTVLPDPYSNSAVSGNHRREHPGGTIIINLRPVTLR